MAGRERSVRAKARGQIDLRVLDADLRRHRRRAARLWRRYQEIDEKTDAAASARAHQDWSHAIDDALSASETISGERPSDIGELAVQFEAAWWWIVEDDSVLDRPARKWLERFRRSLSRLNRQARAKNWE